MSSLNGVGSFINVSFQSRQTICTRQSTECGIATKQKKTIEWRPRKPKRNERMLNTAGVQAANRRAANEQTNWISISNKARSLQLTWCRIRWMKMERMWMEICKKWWIAKIHDVGEKEAQRISCNLALALSLHSLDCETVFEFPLFSYNCCSHCATVKFSRQAEELAINVKRAYKVADWLKINWRYATIDKTKPKLCVS